MSHERDDAVESTETEIGSVTQDLETAYEQHINNLAGGYGDNEPSPDEPKEAVEKKEPEPAPEQKDTKSVPLTALHEERERRRELKGEVERLRQQQSEMENQLKKYMSAVTPKEDTAPDPELDPLGALNYNIRKLADRQEQIDKWKEQQARVEQERIYQEALQKEAGRYAEEYSRIAPDFSEAYKYMQANRIEELKTLGYDDRMAQAIFLDNERAIIEKAKADGVNPAERIYAISKFRGYRAGEVKKGEAPADKIKNLDSGLKASKSLGGGGAPAGYSLDNIAPSDLSSMSDKEFEALFAKQKKSAN